RLRWTAKGRPAPGRTGRDDGRFPDATMPGVNWLGHGALALRDAGRRPGRAGCRWAGAFPRRAGAAALRSVAAGCWPVPPGVPAWARARRYGATWELPGNGCP